LPASYAWHVRDQGDAHALLFCVSVCPESRAIAAANPASCFEDAAYIGQVARDCAAALPSAPRTQAEYDEASASHANAAVTPLDVEATDDDGNALVLHVALRASRPIAKGREVFVAHGFGSWSAAS